MQINSTVTLNNGIKMPIFGLGVFEAKSGDETKNAVSLALKNGYRLIDTAAIYHNEQSVGDALKTTLPKLSLKREDVFITTKLWNSDIREKNTKAAFEKSLKLLGLEYVDLYLIHWPVEKGIKEAWQVMEEFYCEGKIKAIGVSNFRIKDLNELLSYAKIKPSINQVECHPLLSQKELLKFCRSENIFMEAWAPIMKGKFSNIDILENISKKYNKTIAQVILRWHLQNGVIPIPKSVNIARIIENSKIFDFKLEQNDMQKIDSLNENKRFGPSPDNFAF